MRGIDRLSDRLQSASAPSTTARRAAASHCRAVAPCLRLARRTFAPIKARRALMDKVLESSAGAPMLKTIAFEGSEPDMDLRLSRPAWIVGLMLAAAQATASLAQPSTAPSPPSPYERGPAQGQTPADQSDRLRQMLGLSPDQEGALQAFVAAVSPRPGKTAQMRDQARLDAALPPPQRVDRIVAHYDEMRAELLAWAQATKTFYAQLTPDQKRVFDNLPPLRGPQGGAPRTNPPLPLRPGQGYSLPAPTPRS